jgi:xanthine dehydrogenase small subunit
VSAPAPAPDAPTFRLNGRTVPLAATDPNVTLLQHVRAQGLTATKEGCAEGDCGACTVAVLEPGADGRPRYRAVNSCLLLLPALAGLEVLTAEGVASPLTAPPPAPEGADDGAGDPGQPAGRAMALHPVQAALAAAGGSQCGYCTPGFVMTLFADHYPQPGQPRPPLADVLAGNLCRCTGYRPIRTAAEQLRQVQVQSQGQGAEAAAGHDPFARRLQVEPGAAAAGPRRRPLAVHAHGRRFLRPDRLADALAVLTADPEAQPIAGGTDLVLEVTKAFRPLPSLVSLDGIEALRAVRPDAGGWEIGAAATLTEVGEATAGAVPLLDTLLPLFGSLQIRNRATVGGNLCTASPIGDLAPVLLALDAVAVLEGPSGRREVPIEAFFVAYRQTARRRDELLVAVRIPPPPDDGRRLSRVYKVAKRSRVDISTVAAAFCLDLDDAGRVRRARLAYGGVAPTPMRAPQAEAALAGRPWDREALGDARAALDAAFSPLSDLRGGAGYRRSLVRNLLTRLYEETATP